MADEAPQRRCGKPGCQVSATGSCAEGHEPLESCPHFGTGFEGGADDFDDDPTQGHEAPAAEETRIGLHSGDALAPGEVEELLRWRPATLLALIGDNSSGKTTLVCAIFDRFLSGPFAGLAFAGSRTLVAFERRSHHSRVDSGRSAPDTARTSILDDLRYFHLALAPIGKPHARADLLLSDRAGEFYKRARGNSGAVAALTEVPRADRVVLLLDGGRVASAIERAGAMQSVRQTLRALLDAGALGSASIVQVVTTKVDLIAASDEPAEIAEALRSFKVRLEMDFAPRLQELSFWDIAARDPTGGLEAAHGVDPLLTDWTTPRRRSAAASRPEFRFSSEFDRLLARTPLESGR